MNILLMKKITKDNGVRELGNKTEKTDQEIFLKSLKSDNDFNTKKYKGLHIRKKILIITEILLGSASTINSSTLSIFNPTAGITISSNTALSTSIAISIINEYICKLKI